MLTKIIAHSGVKFPPGNFYHELGAGQGNTNIYCANNFTGIPELKHNDFCITTYVEWKTTQLN